MKHIKNFNEAFFDFFKGKPKEDGVDKSISRRRKPTPEEEILNKEQAEKHKEEKERADLMREEEIMNQRKEKQRLQKINAENQRRHQENIRLIEKNRVDLKTELDLIFVDFLDRGIITTCTITKRNKSSVYYNYTFEVKYPITSQTNVISKTFKKISEDILDIEAYIEYIKIKYPSLISKIDFEKGDKKFKLNIVIKPYSGFY